MKILTEDSSYELSHFRGGLPMLSYKKRPGHNVVAYLRLNFKKLTKLYTLSHNPIKMGVTLTLPEPNLDTTL